LKDLCHFLVRFELGEALVEPSPDDGADRIETAAIAARTVARRFFPAKADLTNGFYHKEKREVNDPAASRGVIDYDPKAEQTLEFFSIVQNKLHWAIAGK
jgi:hypothetical protein